VIKEIFLPEKIGNKRLYSEKILGFTIQENIITCAKIFAKPSKTIIEQIISKEIPEEQSSEDFTHFASKAIKEIIKELGKYDKIRISIPSSLVIFKELEVPFKDPDKIRMILDYEIESMLPFSMEESIIDFIITKQELKETKSIILAAAVRKEDLSSILDIYTNAGIKPNNITIDLFAIYSLYQQIPEYQEIKNASALVDLGLGSTRVSVLLDGQLRLTRVLPRGLLTIAKIISDELNRPLKEIETKLLNYGLAITHDEQYDKSLKKHVINFFNDIQFTLNSFSLKLNFYQGISKILFTGRCSQIKDLAKLGNNILQIPCDIFDFEKIFVNKLFKNKLKTIPYDSNLYLAALGTALPSDQQDQFDLRRKIFAIQEDNITRKQIISALIIIFAIFTTISITGYIQINTLTQNFNRIEQRQTEKLRLIFPVPAKIPKNISLRNLMQRAKNLIQDKVQMWEPFKKEKLHPLEILQELTNIIDKRRFDVTIEEVIISQEDGIPKAEVEGYFRSKTGSNHFKYFEELEKRFVDSRFFTLEEEIDPKGVEDKGVKFIAKLRIQE